MILIQHIAEKHVDAYTQQGWRCQLLLGYHGYWRRFMAVIEL